ncbi:MAG: phosphocholine cytidylyltransferase family protein [Bacteroidota bacterium]
MTAVLLAAGIGSRLRPLTNERPKCLLPLGGHSLLHRTLAAFTSIGIERAVIVVGYREAMIREFVSALALPFSVTYVVNERYASTNNNASLQLAGSACAGEEIVVMDADILFHAEILTRLTSAPHENALVLRDGMPVDEEEVKVVLGAGDRVLRISKDISARDAAGESLGIERFAPDSAARLFMTLERRKDRDEFYEAAMQDLIDEGMALHAVRTGGLPCMEIDTPEDLHAAEILVAGMR